MCATAVDPIVVPGPGVHKRLNQNSERIGSVHLELLEQVTQRFRFTSTTHEIFEIVPDLVPEKVLHFTEINKVADRVGPSVCLEQVTDSGAVRVTARQR